MDFDTSYEYLAPGEDVVEEDLMDGDDGSDTEDCKYKLAGVKEAEVKVEEVMSDSCLLCGHSPAVSYDCEGKPIKREPPQLDYSYQQLFSTLCHLLAIRKSCRIWRKWDFETDPFPFCEQCESLMTSLTELRQKLETLESEIKGELRRSEGKFVEEKLYERHSSRYYEFRKAALGEHFLGTETKVVRRTCRKVPIQAAGKDEEDSIDSATMLKPVKQSLSPKGNQMKKGKRQTKTSQVKIRQKKKSKTKKVGRSEVVPKTEFKQMGEPTEKTAERAGSRLPSLEVERVSKSASIIKVRKLKGISAAIRKERWRQRLRQAYDEKYSTLARLSKTPRSEMTPEEKYRVHKRPIVRDPDTHEITLFTGYGNRSMSKRVILTFTKLEEDKTAKIFKYKCDTCSEMVTLHHSTPTIQVREFRAHYRRSHMKVYRCKLCPRDCASTCFTNKQDLLAHLKSAHNVDSIIQMNLKVWGSPMPKVGCHICGMPFDKRLTTQFNLHLKSHMSEEERQNFIVTKRKRKGSILALKGESLCATCGQYGGGCGCTDDTEQHKKIQSDVHKEPSMCSLCGEILSSKYTLAGHMKRVHPDGKPVGPQCKFPTCEERSFDTELSLKEHVSEEHLDSEENRRGLLCLLCGRVFASTQGKSFHKLVHTKEKRFECNFCSKRFPLKATLLHHEVAVHQQGGTLAVFRCEVEECAETFPSKKYLGSHLRKFHEIYKRKQKEKGAQENKG